jgi:hypothetical protein
MQLFVPVTVAECHCSLGWCLLGGAALDQTPAGSSSSTEGGMRGWVRSLAAVWDNIGRAAAVGPTGKDVPKYFDVSDTAADLCK